MHSSVHSSPAAAPPAGAPARENLLCRRGPERVRGRDLGRIPRKQRQEDEPDAERRAFVDKMYEVKVKSEEVIMRQGALAAMRLASRALRLAPAWHRR